MEDSLEVDKKCLEELIHAIDEKKKRDAKERKQRLDEEHKESEADRKFWEKEKKLLPKKLDMAKEIFVWGREFQKTQVFDYLRSVPLPSSNWGHVKGNDDPGRWSTLYLTKEGCFHYKPGYKWMGYKPSGSLILKTPKEMAEKMTFHYLNELYNSIKSGKAYKFIKNQILKPSA